MSLKDGYYREELSPPFWAEGLLLGCVALISGLWFYQLLTGSEVEPNPAPNSVLSVIDVILIGIYLTFRRLVIVLDHEGIQLSYSWIKRQIPYSDIKSVELYTVKPEEYGGLGLRYSNRGGEAFSNRFGEGVRIVRTQDRDIVFTPESPRRVMKLIREFAEIV